MRFRSLAAMATVIAAVGEESAPPGAVDSILSSATLALSAGSSEDAVARECAFRCFGRLATVLERSLAPWLGGAIASAAATLAEAEARGGFQPAVSTGDAGESIAAAEALGALVNSCGFATRPHLAVALAALGRAASSPSSPVALRIAAARSLEFSLRPLEEADDGGGGRGRVRKVGTRGRGRVRKVGTRGRVRRRRRRRRAGSRRGDCRAARAAGDGGRGAGGCARRRDVAGGVGGGGGEVGAPARRRRRRRRRRRCSTGPLGARRVSRRGRVGTTGRTPGRCSSTSRTRREG